MRKNKIQTILFKQAEMNRQLMVLGAVLFFAGIMSTGVLTLVRAGTTDNTNVSLNVSAGALNLDEAPTQVNFAAAGVGSSSVANTGSGAGNGVIVNDTSGSDLGWTITAYYNLNFANGATQMPINDTYKLLANVNLMDVVNGTGLTGDVQTAANFNFNAVGSGAANTVATADATNGQGSFNLYNLEMKYNIPIDAVATNYTTEMVFTVA